MAGAEQSEDLIPWALEDSGPSGTNGVRGTMRWKKGDSILPRQTEPAREPVAGERRETGGTPVRAARCGRGRYP